MLRRFWGLVCLTALFTSSLFAASSSYQIIEQAYQQGTVTAEEKLLLEVQSVKNPSSLPVQFQSSVVETQKCATDILLEAQRTWNEISVSGQLALKALLVRPSATYTYDSPGGKFKIHYSTSGSNAVPTSDVAPANGIPDYVEWLANYSDSSYRAEVITLAQFEPPSDGTLGGDSRYDIYTEEMGYYGYTQSEGAGPNPWNDAYSYISVHRNFIGFPPNDDPDGDQKGAAKVTIAHEYYHAIQFAYDYTEDVWFMEASSTWMEDYVFDPVNDNYNYFPDWFSYPDYALNSTAILHVYAAFIWPKYLSQNFGDTIMPELWNQCITATSYPALTSVLSTHGTTFSAQFAEFCVWNFITGSRNDGNHYEEAVSYPLIKTVRTHTTYPVSAQGPVSGSAPDAMGANYIVFNLPSGSGEFTVTFNGDNSTPWIAKFLAWKAGVNDLYQETQLSLDANGDGSYTLTNPQDFTNAVLVICNVSQSLNDRSYSYGASFVAAPQYAVSVNAVADDSVYSHESTTLRFSVHNVGTLSETFDLAAADNLGWNPVPSSASVSLAPGASQAVSVSVACPPLTFAGTFDTVLLTATGRSMIGVADTDTATTLVFIQPGDADNSGAIDISDVVYLIAFIFSGGPAPVPVAAAGDADCSGTVDISDAVFLIAYIFSGGPQPPCSPF
ncbi:MAG: DUF6055 domain-containing protein [candidate division Zixibacteria bacterium]|nr:DUF6055 domain-containing protein [candidate division Zixibacteria bacterium]